MLRTAMFICDHCVNVVVRNCYFENSIPLTPKNSDTQQTYCYFVYTGTEDFNTEFEPVDGLIYENNYCTGSADCGLDTHGARNVIIRNNVVLDTVCAITAYNDRHRAKRPDGWKMENILIENNYCDSKRQNLNPSNEETLPHPFLFVGMEDINASYDEFKNCIIRNNTFRTANNFIHGAIYTGAVSRNVIFDNNVFEFYSSPTGAVKVIRFGRSFWSVFKNNRIENSTGAVYFKQFFGECKDNYGFSYSYSGDSISYIKGLENNFSEILPPTCNLGDIIYRNGLCICTSYGIRLRFDYLKENQDIIKTFSINVDDNGIAEVINDKITGEEVNFYIPHLSLLLNNDTPAYIKDILDKKHFIIVNGNQNLIGEGTYNVTLRDAQFYTFPTS